MKITLKITANGQVTLPEKVMGHLGVRPGDRITLKLVAPGRAEIGSLRLSSEGLVDFIGCLNKPGTPRLSLSEIKRIAD